MLVVAQWWLLGKEATAATSTRNEGRIHKWRYLKHASEEKIERNPKKVLDGGHVLFPIASFLVV